MFNATALFLCVGLYFFADFESVLHKLYACKGAFRKNSFHRLIIFNTVDEVENFIAVTVRRLDIDSRIDIVVINGIKVDFFAVFCYFAIFKVYIRKLLYMLPKTVWDSCTMHRLLTRQSRRIYSLKLCSCCYFSAHDKPS